MTAKEYLLQYANAEDKLAQLNEAIMRAEASLDSMSIDYSGMPHGSGTSDKTGAQALRLTDLKERYIEQYNEARVLVSEIEYVIMQVENPNGRAVLLDRYIDRMKWEDIARHLHFDISYVAGHLHGNALQEVSNILNCQKNSKE